METEKRQEAERKLQKKKIIINILKEIEDAQLWNKNKMQEKREHSEKKKVLLKN